MDKLLKQLDTKSVNLSDLTPHYVNRDANIKLLKKLDERNKARQQRTSYKYNDVLAHLKARTTRQLDNPKAYAVDGNSNPENQKMELIRMAKITAKKAMEGGSTMSEYLGKKEKFMTTYSKKINEFRMIPMIDDIFEKFKDINYKEKGYDTDYLGQGVSNDYLKSLQSKEESKKLIQKLEELDTRRSTDIGKVHHLLESQNRLSLTDMTEDERKAMEDENKSIIQEFKDELSKKKRKDSDDGEERKGDGEDIEEKLEDSMTEKIEKKLAEIQTQFDEDEALFITMDEGQLEEYVKGVTGYIAHTGTTKPLENYLKDAYDMLTSKYKNNAEKLLIKKAINSLDPSKTNPSKTTNAKLMIEIGKQQFKKTQIQRAKNLRKSIK